MMLTTKRYSAPRTYPLGSGNHFIEVSLDEQDRLWLFLHSGSQGVGNRLANKHIKIARQLCRTSRDLNCHHNYTEQPGELLSQWRKRDTGHRGHGWLTRKGAIDASGKARPAWSNGRGTSSRFGPHPTARAGSSAVARRGALSSASSLTQRWRVLRGRSDVFLDEIHGAYKDIDTVMPTRPTS